MDVNSVEPGSRAELLSNIRRLTTIVLDKLEQGSRKDLLDEVQLQRFSSIALRCIGQWNDCLKEDRRRAKLAMKDMRKTEAELSTVTDDRKTRGVEC